MNRYQTYSVVDWQGWREFLELRLNQYLQRFCSQTDSLSHIRTANLIAPSSWREGDLSTACLTDHIIPPEVSNDSRWIGRPDAFDVASDFLQDLSATTELKKLFCLDELARPGDSVLKDKHYIVHNEYVFYWANLENSSTDDVVWTLRSGRAFGLSGLICEQSVRELCDNVTGRKFITDAFDGDMVVVCEF